MKRLLLPLLVALPLTTAVNATNYIECEAIYSVIERTENRKYNARKNNRDYPNIYKYDPKPYDAVLERAKIDFNKRNCYYLID